jgi:ribonuclease P protein subunit RPR2
MAKAKPQKGAAGAVQSHLRARISYLYKASVYLQSRAAAKSTDSNQGKVHEDVHDEMSNESKITRPPLSQDNTDNKAKDSVKTSPSRLSRQYLSQMRGVSRKSQLRLPVDIKHSVCKRCDALLISGSTCTEEIENRSSGKRKPWADVLVVRCTTCATPKRFPRGHKRSTKMAQEDRRCADWDPT